MYENALPIWMQAIDGRVILLVLVIGYFLNKARTSGKACQCLNLDDDLIAEGWTCYNCYENNS